MTHIDLDDAYEHCRAVHLALAEKFPQADPKVRQALNVAGEAGEFVEAFRRWMGMARRNGTHAEMMDELADVVIAAFVMAHTVDGNLTDAVAHKLRIVTSRGYKEGEI